MKSKQAKTHGIGIVITKAQKDKLKKEEENKKRKE